VFDEVNKFIATSRIYKCKSRVCLACLGTGNPPPFQQRPRARPRPKAKAKAKATSIVTCE